MEVFSCGTEVKLNHTDIKGYVTAIIIRDNRVTYEISYFSNGSYYSHNFSHYEFSSIKDNKIKIGFK
jgi:hypothetical protein